MWTNTTDHVSADLKKYGGCRKYLIFPRKPRKEGNEFWEWEEGKKDSKLKNLLINFLKKNRQTCQKNWEKKNSG